MSYSRTSRTARTTPPAATVTEPQRVRSASDMNPAAGTHAKAPSRYATKIVVPLAGLLAARQLHDPDHELDQCQYRDHGHADEVPVLRRLVTVGRPAAPGGEQQRGDAGHQRQDVKHGSDPITAQKARRPRPRPAGTGRAVGSKI